MDSDDEILPKANIFEIAIDNIWQENMDVYKREFKFKEYDINEENNEIASTESNKEVEEDDKDCVLGTQAKELLREITARKQARYKGRRKKNKRKGENTDTIDGYEGIRLTAAAKKRIREAELEAERNARRIEEENKMAFAMCDTNLDLDEPHLLEPIKDTNRDISIKIRYQSKVSKVKAREKEEFKSIFQKVADLYGMKATGFLLCLGDNNIKLNDTPESLNIRICDIIDCIPYDQEEETINNSHKLLLKIQSNDTRKKTEIRAHKLEKFLEVMKKYAEMRKLPLESLTFEFDGELIQPDETPLDLDMESGSCIDVRVSNATKPSKKRTSSEAKNIKPIPMMDIIELD